MCGIFGAITTPKFTQQRMLYQLSALAMQTRGRMSFGAVFGGLKNENLQVVREVGKIGEFPDMVGHVGNSRLIMLHTRLATHGANVEKNCHPFQYNEHLVTHNGVIYNYDEVDKSKNYRVDSMALARRIAYNRDVSDLQGYGAVGWVAPDGGLYTSRMDRGDLELFTVSDGHGKAHCYISDLEVRIWGSKYIETLESVGLKVVSSFEPDVGDVYRVTTRGHTKKARRLELGGSDYFYDWRSGYQSSYRTPAKKTPPLVIGSSSANREARYRETIETDHGEIKLYNSNPDHWHWCAGFLTGNSEIILWRIFPSHRQPKRGDTMRGYAWREEMDWTRKLAIYNNVLDKTAFRSLSKHADAKVGHMIEDSKLSDFLRQNTISPWELQRVGRTEHGVEPFDVKWTGGGSTFEIHIKDEAAAKAVLSEYTAWNPKR